MFSVPGLHLRNLTEVIKVAVQERSSRFFHYTPFKQFWKEKATDEPQRVYDEIYTSDAFITAHEKLQRQPPEPGCDLERVILALMFWSDSTHLANFGTASLWPLYLFFGNQSKWVRGKPRAGACHHVAYMPKVSVSFRYLFSSHSYPQLPDDFNNLYRTLVGEAPSAELLTHCRWELMHPIWCALLDEQFIDACEHGVVIECPDGISRCFYFRLFTYSADYPEKCVHLSCGLEQPSLQFLGSFSRRFATWAVPLVLAASSRKRNLAKWELSTIRNGGLTRHESTTNQPDSRLLLHGTGSTKELMASRARW